MITEVLEDWFGIFKFDKVFMKLCCIRGTDWLCRGESQQIRALFAARVKNQLMPGRAPPRCWGGLRKSSSSVLGEGVAWAWARVGILILHPELSPQSWATLMTTGWRLLSDCYHKVP